jgi:hypothetical protein
MKTLVVIVAAIILLPIAAFCMFGFMATFEPTDRPEVFMAFRIGYGLVRLGCLLSLVLFIARLFRS